MIILGVIIHWYLTVFVHAIYLHRYKSHKQFALSKKAERVFNIISYLITGSSYLDPTTYSICHKLHHSHSDRNKDPHSPANSKNYFVFHLVTIKNFMKVRNNIVKPGQSFIQKFASSIYSRITWIFIYIIVYLNITNSLWYLLLVPFHAYLLILQGSIINWCGHRYGYKNFENLKDNSTNTLSFDILFFGELLQNNHHKNPSRLSSSYKKKELDLIYFVLIILNKLSIIKI